MARLHVRAVARARPGPALGRPRCVDSCYHVVASTSILANDVTRWAGSSSSARSANTVASSGGLPRTFGNRRVWWSPSIRPRRSAESA
jgi:hypothetical protein